MVRISAYELMADIRPNHDPMDMENAIDELMSNCHIVGHTLTNTSITLKVRLVHVVEHIENVVSIGHVEDLINTVLTKHNLV